MKERREERERERESEQCERKSNRFLGPEGVLWTEKRTITSETQREGERDADKGTKETSKYHNL